MRNILKALLTAAIFVLPFGVSADYINDGDYQDVGSRVGVDGPMTPEECHPYPVDKDGGCKWPEGGDGPSGGGPSGAGPAPDGPAPDGPAPDGPAPDGPSNDGEGPSDNGEY